MGNALAVDQSNYIYVTGTTNSPDFPVKSYPNVLINNQVFNNNYKGNSDVFIVKLEKQHLENLVASSLLGGSARDVGTGVAVDPLGRVYIVGGTYSTDMQTTIGAKQRQNNGIENGFVTIMDKQLQNVLSSTYLGGNGDSIANGIVVSDLGNIGIVGTTNSTNFPGVSAGDISSYGQEDVFLTTFKNVMTSQELLQTTILGGANADYGQAIAIDNSSNYTWREIHGQMISQPQSMLMQLIQVIICNILTMHL